MSIRHLPCGDFVNTSERLALERLRDKLRNAEGSWLLLSNLNHTRHPSLHSDEIDLLVIGPTGVHVIEVKHWDAAYLRERPFIVEREAERINDKAKRVAGKLRQKFDPGFVTPRLLLTRGELKFDAAKRPRPRGVEAFGLPEWRELLAVGSAERLTPEQVEWAAKLLEPTVKLALTGELRTFAGLVNLERRSDPADAFHRGYRGQHPSRRDRVILHVYDLSASQEKNALELARREFETIQRWQKSAFVPSLLDSFQEAEGYPGELFFFSLVDPAAPTLSQRGQDPTWDIPARIAYALAAINALAQFHQPDEAGLTPLVHRRITPHSLRVRHNGQPLFTDFSVTRLQDAQTVSGATLDLAALTPFLAPEVQTAGLAAADTRSDIFALCASLATIFDTDPSQEVRAILASGCAPDPEERATLAELAAQLGDLRDDAKPPIQNLPAPEYWDEDTIVPFQNSRYKIVSHLGQIRLGQGGIGQTYKVVELDSHSDEKFGTYVAKLVRHEEDGKAALRAYRKVRSYSTHPQLSAIHEIAPDWEENRFVALMKWVEGIPLLDLMGVLSIHAEDLGESSAESLALRWLADLCAALGELHRAGLVHGDISPRNIIVQGGSVVLTDYDTVADAGRIPWGGTLPYASPGMQSRTLHGCLSYSLGIIRSNMTV